MSRKTEKVVCRASSRDFVFADFAGTSFSTPTPVNVRRRALCTADHLTNPLRPGTKSSTMRECGEAGSRSLGNRTDAAGLAHPSG